MAVATRCCSQCGDQGVVGVLVVVCYTFLIQCSGLTSNLFSDLKSPFIVLLYISNIYDFFAQLF